MKVSTGLPLAGLALGLAFTSPAIAADCTPMKGQATAFNEPTARTGAHNALETALDGARGKMLQLGKRGTVKPGATDCRPFHPVGLNEIICVAHAELCPAN